MRYWVVDDALNSKGEIYVESFDTKEEAFDRAEDIFAHLTDGEKRERTALTVVLGEEDEDGQLDFDSVRHTLKSYI